MIVVVRHRCRTRLVSTTPNPLLYLYPLALRDAVWGAMLLYQLWPTGVWALGCGVCATKCARAPRAPPHRPHRT
jgi:hypothetical protein